jgi:hypothetical protein
VTFVIDYLHWHKEISPEYVAWLKDTLEHDKMLDDERIMIEAAIRLADKYTWDEWSKRPMGGKVPR